MTAIDFTGIRIMVIGDLMLNAGSVERISPEAPVPGLVRESERTVGGCGHSTLRYLLTSYEK
jgi:bifunctional ADP-heptose synthase (sugar kinase/adenylyltransferase)